MQLTTVDSSMVHAIGYDPAERTLEVIFLSGRIYLYFGVPLDVYEEFLEAPSKGRYFLTHIEDQFEERRLGR